MIITFTSLGVLVQFSFVNAQSDERLPVLLIHGYHSGPEVWTHWVDQLHHDGFDAEAVYFEDDDDCGSSEAHAYELNEIIEQFKVMTNSDKINIVAHSKGGLDARWYLANYPNDNVNKLIMIGYSKSWISPSIRIIDGTSPNDSLLAKNHVLACSL